MSLLNAVTLNSDFSPIDFEHSETEICWSIPCPPRWHSVDVDGAGCEAIDARPPQAAGATDDDVPRDEVVLRVAEYIGRLDFLPKEKEEPETEEHYNPR